MTSIELDGASEALLTHRLLTSTDDVWLQLHEGELTADQAASRLRGHEPDEAIEEATSVFGKPFADEDAQHFPEVLRLYEHGDQDRTRYARRLRWLGWSTIALAAALLIWWLQPPGLIDTSFEPELQRQLAEIRGASEQEGIATYRQDRTIEIWLRPMHAVDGPVGAKAFVRRDGEIRALPVDPSVADGGSVHIVARADELGLALGNQELLLVVGRPDDLPDSVVPEQAAQEATDASPYEVIVVPIRIVAPQKEGPR